MPSLRTTTHDDEDRTNRRARVRLRRSGTSRKTCSTSPREGPREVPGLHVSPEGHHLCIDASGSLQGVTVVGALDILEHAGRVPVSMPHGRPIGEAEVAEVVLSSARG